MNSKHHASIAAPAALWLETIDSVFKWYGAMFRFAFGLDRLDSGGRAHVLIAPPPVKPEDSTPQSSSQSNGQMDDSVVVEAQVASPAPTPLTSSAKSSRGAALHSVPTPLKLRPRRVKKRSRGTKKPRSSKMLSTKGRQRRAA